MQSFEHIADGETYASSIFIQPMRQALWARAFGVHSLAGLFDMTPAAQAIPVLDAAISRFNAAPDELRPLVADADVMGLRGNRALLVKLRNLMNDHGGTISGAVDEHPDTATT